MIEPGASEQMSTSSADRSRSGSGQVGPRSPHSSTNLPGKGHGDHTPPPRPTLPLPGQATGPQHPFPSRSPLGGAVADTSPARGGQPVVYFYDERGEPLEWSHNGPVPAARSHPFRGQFAAIELGGLLSAGGPGSPAWLVIEVRDAPALTLTRASSPVRHVLLQRTPAVPGTGATRSPPTP